MIDNILTIGDKVYCFMNSSSSHVIISIIRSIWIGIGKKRIDLGEMAVSLFHGRIVLCTHPLRNERKCAIERKGRAFTLPQAISDEFLCNCTEAIDCL